MVHFYLLQHWQVVKETDEKHNHRKLRPVMHALFLEIKALP